MEYSLLYLMPLILITALFGTGVILFVLIKYDKKEGQTDVRSESAEQSFDSLLSKKKVDLKNTDMHAERIDNTRDNAEFRENRTHSPEDHVDDETAETHGLDHRMYRGNGEMDFMMKLQAESSAVKEKIKKINLNNVGKGNWLGKVKKMGIGKGEVKLAKHLKEFENTTIKSERYV